MGFVDPMAFGNLAMTGVLEFGSGPILWALTLGLLVAAAAAIAAAGWHPRQGIRRAPVAGLRREATGMRVVGRAT